MVVSARGRGKERGGSPPCGLVPRLRATYFGEPIVARETTYTGNQPQGLSAAADPVEFIQVDAASGESITINDDGSVEISDTPPTRELSSEAFNENLAEILPQNTLASIANDIIEGVQSDLTSRAGFMENYNKGLELLGLKIEDVTTARAQKRNVSRVGHPLLLEAVIRFQALARNELLPAIGPCKVMTVGGSDAEQDELASGMESDMNFFLTQIDKGYYPDFDRALFSLGFGGNVFKKVYRDPLKRYPVSRSIQLEDFIVSEDASDIHNAQRATHRIYIKDSTLKKLQYAKEYIDIPLNPGQPTQDSTKIKQENVMGISSSTSRPEDMERELYETYTDLDLGSYGYKEKDAPSGLPLPYIITVDVASRTVLSLRRNWKDGDEHYAQRRRIVHYGLLPSFGFLCLGYLHLLGNQTRALRAIWRILIDAGMFSSFPGGLKAKGVRTDTNEIAPSPGEFVDIDIGPFDKIQDAMMLMPYKDPSNVFMALAQQIGSDSQRMGGIPEMSFEEGRTHIPVGTMMQMVEQATQTMSSVHKRIHAAMQEELTLLKELFAEDPEALTRLARKPSRDKYVAEEFNDVDLVPATDPNIPSQMHRIQQATALIALSKNAPGLYDPLVINQRALKAIGINDWQTIIHPPAAPQIPPEIQLKMAELQVKQLELQQEANDAQRKAASEATQSINSQKQAALDRASQIEELKLKREIAYAKEETARLRIQVEEQQARREFAGEFAIEKVKQETERLKLGAETHRQHTSDHIKGQYSLQAAKLKPKPAPAKPKPKAKS